MAKSKKPTLKEDFFAEFNLGENTMDAVWKFFAPHLRKTAAKPKLELPKDKIKEFNELWPAAKLPPNDQYGRCSPAELESSFRAFLTEYPSFNNWDAILECGRIYLREKEAQNWEYTRRSKYFVRRELKDKSVEFLIAEYYQRLLDGTQEENAQKTQGFQPRIV